MIGAELRTPPIFVSMSFPRYVEQTLDGHKQLAERTLAKPLSEIVQGWTKWDVTYTTALKTMWTPGLFSLEQPSESRSLAGAIGYAYCRLGAAAATIALLSKFRESENRTQEDWDVLVGTLAVKPNPSLRPDAQTAFFAGWDETLDIIRHFPMRGRGKAGMDNMIKQRILGRNGSVRPVAELTEQFSADSLALVDIVEDARRAQELLEAMGKKAWQLCSKDEAAMEVCRQLLPQPSVMADREVVEPIVGLWLYLGAVIANARGSDLAEGLTADQPGELVEVRDEVREVAAGALEHGNFFSRSRSGTAARHVASPASWHL